MDSFRLNTEGKYALGLDLGGTTMAAAVIDQSGVIVGQVASDVTPARSGAEAVATKLVSTLRRALESSQIDPADLMGIGMAVPGQLKSSEGLVIFSPNFDWHNVNIARPVAEAFGLRTFIFNDVNTATLGELWFGAGRAVDNMVMITLGTGIGGGVAIEGRVLAGPREAIGEIGHITLEPDGPRCECGNHGCFEALAGRDALVDRAIRKLQNARPSLLLELVKGDLSAITPKAIAEAAQAGDEVALETLRETAVYIGIALCTAINFADPDLIVIGGGIASAGDVLFEPIRATIKTRARMIPYPPERVVPAELGNLAGVYGGAVLVFQASGVAKPA